MALTMTRTRTQTTLTKLAGLLANINGELAFVEELLASSSQPDLLLARKASLLTKREALLITIRQFDPELNPEDIGTSYDWLQPYGRGKTPTALAKRRYMAALTAHQP